MSVNIQVYKQISQISRSLTFNCDLYFSKLIKERKFLAANNSVTSQGITLISLSYLQSSPKVPNPEPDESNTHPPIIFS
jgi:hypothetical protein